MKNLLMILFLVLILPLTSFAVYSPSLFPNGKTIGSFLNLTIASSVDTSATTNATVTPAGSLQYVDTHQDVAISTVNIIVPTINVSGVTTQLPIGTVVRFATVADGRDVVFAEGGNFFVPTPDFAALTTTVDVVAFELIQLNKWRCVEAVDNN